MDKSKIEVKEAIISIIEGYLKENQSLSKQMYYK